LEEHGPFSVDEKHLLQENEFMHIYDLIETRARFSLHVLRTKNEENRTQLFRKSFIEKGHTGD
jgi:hypothetical protein